MFASVADRASQRPKTVTSQRVSQPVPLPVLAAGPSVHTFKEFARNDVHRNHHRTHNQPEPTPSIHNPTHQHPNNPTRTLRRPKTPHHDGRRETFLHVAGRP